MPPGAGTPSGSGAPSGSGSTSQQPPSETPDPPTPTPTPTPTKPAVDCKKSKCFALTFDDGPSPDTTPQLLKILKKHKAKATFFQLGTLAKEYPELVKEIHDMGSEVANHSWDHDSLDRKSVDGAYEDMKKANEAIEAGCGCKVTLMRPPYGATDKGVDKATKKLGLAQILWDIDTLDWDTHDPYDIRSKVVHSAGKNRIALMHDIHQTTIDAVDEMIEELYEDDFKLVTVSEMLGDTVPGKRYPKSWASYGN
ncbi:polysaccharide deacetylase family protein [Microlunatus speluncae]|uniref:polysaccharide deacetylase family protein n=1 Tax=Microlunatus speluncae TaxID=2594267 RepID=UPI00137564BC|nr:polysaccharide deacetylase family protein [Microlunatus speluncae]